MKPRPRVFAGGLTTETNSFSPLPTGYDDFRKVPPSAPQEDRDTIFFGRSFRSYATVAERHGLDLRIGSYAFAIPAGPPTRAVYQRLRDTLLSEVRAELPLNGVLLTLHGAMVCDGVPDCESDIVLRIRELVGEHARIGVLLDLHCDLPPDLVEAADAVVVVREYPHVDAEPRAAQLAEVVAGAIAEGINPVMSCFDCRVVGLFPTVREPMRTFVDDVLIASEGERGVLAASLGHGFPYLDAPGASACALVVSDGNVLLAERLAEHIGRCFYEIRHEARLVPVPLEAALRRALAGGIGGPVVLADTADNAGGGAPSDSTFVLSELIRRGVRGAAIAPLWDPHAVQLAFAAELGSTLELRLGGKVSRASGEPVDVTARVKGLCRDLVQRWPQADGFAEMPVGDAAMLDVGGIDVVVVSRRDQAFGLELFTAFGVDPSTKQVLVLKSANHFRAAYDPIASEVLYVDAGGALPADPRDNPFTRFNRQAFPWIDDPLDPPRADDLATSEARAL
jgi:microcystin degradation protein MlrC